MGKGAAGCLTLIIGVVIIGLLYTVIRWTAFNVLGLLGIILVIAGIVLLIKRKKTGAQVYWPIAGIVNGLVLTFSWFIFKEWMNALGFMCLFLFLFFLVTAFGMLITKRNTWKKFAGFSLAVFIVSMIFILNAPKIETSKQHQVSEDPKKSAIIKKHAAHQKKKEQTAKRDEEKNSAPNTTTETPNTTEQPKDTASSPSVSPNPPINANQVPVTLVATIDGDTIKVLYNGKEETVRYLLVDTPEEKKPGTCVQPYAMDAANRNKQIVNSGKLTLEFEHSRTDKYGRLLAYVFVNGSSVQETLLKEGYARVAYIYEPPYKYLDQYRNDENLAKNEKINIWSKPGYSTDRGFMGCVNSTAQTGQKPSTSNRPQPTAPSTSTGSSGTTEFFANCTELRKKYPDGVKKGHPAYQDKMDRDKDGVACERY